MVKLNNAQIDALVQEARQKIEEANQVKVEKFAKTNKKLAELLKMSKQYSDLTDKKNELDRSMSCLRAELNTSADFKKNNFSVDYNGKVVVDTWRVSSELRNKLVIHTIGKDFNIDEVLSKLVAEYIK